MKKTVLIFLLCAFMLFFVAEASAAVLTPTVTVDSVSAVISCGADAAGKIVTVEVFEPESGFADLSTDGGDTYTQTSPEKVNAAISFLYQGQADSYGNVSFIYKPKGLKGKYYYRIAVAGNRTKTEGYFEFMTDNDAQAIIDDLKDGDVDASDIEAIFRKSDSPNVYNSYQILEADKSELFEYFDSLMPETKSDVYSAIVARLGDITNAEEFVNVFAEIVYAEVIDLKTGKELLKFIDALKVYSGIDQHKEYTNIRLNEKVFDSDVKADFISNMENMPLKDKSVEKITELTATQLLTSALSKSSTYGILDSVICDFETEITAAGGKVIDYKENETPLNIARKLIEKRPFDDMSDFVTNLNEVIASFGKLKDKANDRTPSRGGDSFVVSGTNNKEVTTEDLNLNPSPVIQTTAFSDLDGYEWANEAVAYMKNHGIINGIGNGLFAPGANVKREEFAKMIVLAFDLKADAQMADFADVQKDSWCAPYVAAASGKGVIKGIGDRIFGVGQNITREDMAVMCYRVIQSEGIELDIKRGNPNFSDSISDYASEAVNELYRAEILNGTGGADSVPNPVPQEQKRQSFCMKF